jgi:hypothetical protein
MLTRAELASPPAIWLPALEARLRGCPELRALPDAARDVGLALELGRVVAEGGVLLYFLGDTCLHAFDAWFALDAIDPPARAILDGALRRVGVAFGLDLDLPAMVAAGGGALPAAFGGLVDAIGVIRRRPGPIADQVATLRGRLGGDRGEVAGFETLDRRCWAHDLRGAIVTYINAHPAAFLVD